MKEIPQALQQQGLANLASYFERPVSDPSLLRSLRQRADAFEFNGYALPCPIVPELTFDMGSRRLNSQLFISVIDMPNSKGLMEAISRKLGYEATPENTGAALVVERTFAGYLSKKLGKPARRSQELLVVVRLDEAGLASQHVLTPSTMKAIVVPSRGQRHLEDDIKQFNALIPHASQQIRWFDDSVIAWNGKQWGFAEFAPEGNLVVGNRSIVVGKFGQFHPADLGQALRTGMAGGHTEYNDQASDLMIPAPGLQPNRPGFRDWFMQAGDLVHTVGQDPGGGGGSGGGQGSSDITWIFSGTGTCSHRYTSLDSCYGCCDTLGASALAIGITAAGATTAAVGAVAIPTTAAGGPVVGVGMLITVIVGVVSLVGASAAAYGVTQACKDACDHPIGIGQPSTTSSGLAPGLTGDEA